MRLPNGIITRERSHIQCNGIRIGNNEDIQCPRLVMPAISRVFQEDTFKANAKWPEAEVKVTHKKSSCARQSS